MRDAVVNSNKYYSKAPGFVVTINGTDFANGNVYKTHDFPPRSLPADVKVVFMYGNPMNAAVSSFKAFAGPGKQHYVHAHSPFADDHENLFERDVLLMEKQFRAWMQPQKFALCAVRYEALSDGSICDQLGHFLNCEMRFPEFKERESSWRNHERRSELENTYGKLAEEMERFSAITIFSAIEVPGGRLNAELNPAGRGALFRCLFLPRRPEPQVQQLLSRPHRITGCTQDENSQIPAGHGENAGHAERPSAPATLS